MSDSITTSVSWPNYSASNVQTASSKDTQTMGKDQFLKILITQLQNQNPMDPMDDKEFIAQMAQFSTVEQLSNISTQLDTMSSSLGSVSSLIGKQATWMQDTSSSSNEYVIDGDTSSSDGYTLTGIIDGIVVRSGIQYAIIGSNEVPVTDITQIDSPDDSSGSEDGSTDSESDQSGSAS
ncbi:flagellar hook assembly protein FlgD [Paenibacillus pinistramenti]|uniref:flagellar hook assembly protein FlgD n=1 Tax=Paenibacillus pinistramenti TaxID=1768003 RepID=UPI00110976B3|nr:flagellar hook capping FlgD N-terminal domain-containing protein [Paenibacillus pinistramenti]